MSDIYTTIDVPGFGEKRVLVMTGGAGVADYGDPKDCFVTLENGKRAMLILAEGLEPSAVEAESFKAYITSKVSSVAVNAWTDFPGFTKISAESPGEYITLNADGKTFECHQDGLYQFGGCIHYQNNSAGIFSSLTVLSRIFVNAADEARCSQRGVVIAFAAGGEEVLSYTGTAALNSGDTFTLQYFTDESDLEFYSNSNFENPVAATLWTNYIGEILDA